MSPKEKAPKKEILVVDEQMLKDNPMLASAGVTVGTVGTEASDELSAELDAKLKELVTEPVTVQTAPTGIGTPCDYCNKTGLLDANTLCPKCQGTLMVKDDSFKI